MNKLLSLCKKSLVAAVLMGSTAANATLIDEWTFDIDTSFVGAPTFTGGDGSTGFGAFEISWGSAAGDFQNPTGDFTTNRSALTIGTPGNLTGGGTASGNIDTTFAGQMLDIGLGSNFTHWNNTIDGGFATLSSGTITTSLALTPFMPAAMGAPSIGDLIFNFEFRETPNDGPCAGGTPTPCGDLWGFSGTPNLNVPFSFDGEDYFASIFVLNADLSGSPIAFLNDDQCAALGFTTGTSGQRCQGFLTTESAATTVQFGLAVSSERIRVPEPSMAMVLGLGLLALCSARRRKIK